MMTPPGKNGRSLSFLTRLPIRAYNLHGLAVYLKIHRLVLVNSQRVPKSLFVPETRE